MTPDEFQKRRKKLGLTQAELALALDRPIDTIQNWEQGRRAIPAPGILRYVLTSLDREKTAYGADHAAFVASLATFLSRDASDSDPEYHRFHNNHHGPELTHSGSWRWEWGEGAANQGGGASVGGAPAGCSELVTAISAAVRGE